MSKFFDRKSSWQREVERQQHLKRELGSTDLLRREVEREEHLRREWERQTRIEPEWRRQQKVERQSLAELAAAQTPVYVYLSQLSSRIDRAQDKASHDFLEMKRSAYEAALGPLLSPALYNYTDRPSLVAASERLNSAIADAVYIGEIEIDTEQEEDVGPSAETDDSTLEERLVDVVSADVLSKLKSVDFLPLNALDRILRSPEAMRSLSARDFELFVATLIDQLGFEDVQVTPRSGDQGRDILAVKSVHGISILFAFECKRYKPENPVGPDILRALLGTIRHGRTSANKGVLVTASTFTSGAREYLLLEPALDGKDFEGVVDWLKEYGSQSRGEAI